MATSTRAAKQPTNPRYFPRDVTPVCILKGKNGNFHYLMSIPDESKHFLWYMSEPKLVTMEELAKEMQVPGRRWYATDRAAYELQVKVGGNTTTDGVPYVCLRHVDDSNLYYFGKRHVEEPPTKVELVVTVAELYLKSSMHQKRLVRLLMDSIRRILSNPQIFRCGNTMIEIRGKTPTEEETKLLALLPGIAKIYAGCGDERNGDPRGKFLMDGAGGIPIIPDQRALALLSGGIDSPVAAYRMMTRGCHVSGVHYLNSTNDTASVIEKNRRICEKLSLVQGSFEMYYVDISKLQSQIVAQVPNHNRTLIYKWFMLSLSAGFDDARFIITGDSAGQVASQTVPNIATLYPTIKKAVIAPLIGMPKTYIMEEARKIGTYDISIQEGADCCQYMMCKTGANLLIGRRTVEACVSKISLSELPVLKEVYRQGKLCESSDYTFFPDVGLRTQQTSQQQTTGAAAAKSAEEEEEVVYFDAAAATKVAPQVKAAMLSAPDGNPNSMHKSGREARMAIEQARSEVAKALGVPANDIIFTSGGTESNNIALNGYRVLREAWSHASTSQFASAPDDAPVVRVVDLVNHETGSINRNLKRPPNGRLHVDASQALKKVDFSEFDLSEVDSMTVTAHKINGPVGVGAVYLRNLQCNKLFSGGSQEKGIRPGTENVPAIVGFAAALRLDRSHSIHREIDTVMVEELQALGCEINRRGETSGFIIHVTLPEGYVNTDVVSLLSTKYNVEIGTGSACKTNELNTTVYDTLGKTPAPNRSLRLSWDSFTTMDEAERVVNAMKKALGDLRSGAKR